MKRLSEIVIGPQDISIKPIDEFVKWYTEANENIEFKTEQEVEDIFKQIELNFLGFWEGLGKNLLERCNNDKMQSLTKNKKNKRVKLLTDYYEFIAKHFS
jgi:hypothetical protein